MELKISSKNEYKFYPDIMDNLEKEESARFAIVVKKINYALTKSSIYEYDQEGNYLGINNKGKLRENILRIDNAPTLDIDGKEKREMTIDDLLEGKFEALYDIVVQLNLFINKLETGGKETKKS